MEEMAATLAVGAVVGSGVSQRGAAASGGSGQGALAPLKFSGAGSSTPGTSLSLAGRKIFYGKEIYSRPNSRGLGEVFRIFTWECRGCAHLRGVVEGRYESGVSFAGEK